MPVRIDRKITFVGSGNMAGAILKGLLRGKLDPQNIWCVDVRPERLRELAAAHGVRVGSDVRQACAWADVVILATKPQVLDSVLPFVVLDDALAVSIVAGVSLDALEDALGTRSRVIRAMPNTPATVMAGATALAAGTNASADDLELAKEIFAAVGTTIVIDESSMDAVTGLSGSGPGFVFMIIEAMADGAVKMGLTRESALMLATQTVFGAAKLVLETGEHPARLKDAVASPGGTTIAALHVLESGALRSTLMDAVEAAALRSRALGEAARKKASERT